MNYNDLLRQQIVERFYRETGKPEATAHEMAVWAIKNRIWEPEPSNLAHQLADQLARAMREETFVDPQGRVVRAKHAARIKQGEKQLTLWADMRWATRDHMKVSFQQRRHQVVGECIQLKRDVDSYNDNWAPENAQIQLSLDFTFDVAEAEALD